MTTISSLQNSREYISVRVKGSKPIPRKKEIDDDLDDKKTKRMVTQDIKVARNIALRKKLSIFDEDNLEEETLFYSALSYQLSAEDSIRQRVICFIPLEVVTLTTYTVQKYALLYFSQYILKKFKIPFNRHENVKELFLRFPPIIDELVFQKLSFDISNFKDIDVEKNDFDHLREVFSISQSLCEILRKLKIIAMDIHQNNFYL